jgi:periplasmic protein TonB
LTLDRGILYSLFVHVVIFAVLILLPSEKGPLKKGSEYQVGLISPEDVPPQTRSLPRLSPPPLRSEPVPPPVTEGRRQDERETPPIRIPEAPPLRDRNGGSIIKESSPGGSSGGMGAGSEAQKRPSKEQLFDREIIGDLAKKQEKAEEEKRRGRSFTFDAGEYRFLIYNRRLKEKIESIWVYPPEEAARGIYGDLIIKFTILKNGRLGDVVLVRTSGHQSLDRAAVKALRDGEPYWPLPGDWGIESYTIEGHFIYTIYGYYVM